MPKKVVKDEVLSNKVDATKLSLGDLWVLFQIVNADLNAMAGKSASAKGIVGSRHSEVKNELYQRVYGCDPFTVPAVVVEGELPEKVLANVPSEMIENAKAQRNFVVSKPGQEKDQ